jgi:hypothetical protein
MDQSVAVAVRRNIVDLEERVHKQDTLVKQLLATELDAVQATLTLRALQQTLLLTREHLRFALRDEMGKHPPAGPTAEHCALEEVPGT